MLSDHARAMLGQARASLSASKAHLCPHGIDWSICRDHDADKPCKGRNTNICVAEGCYAQACIRTDQPVEDNA